MTVAVTRPACRSPTGTWTACTLAAPCALATAAGKPSPGETVYLRGFGNRWTDGGTTSSNGSSS